MYYTSLKCVYLIMQIRHYVIKHAQFCIRYIFGEINLNIW